MVKELCDSFCLRHQDSTQMPLAFRTLDLYDLLHWTLYQP